MPLDAAIGLITAAVTLFVGILAWWGGSRIERWKRDNDVERTLGYVEGQIARPGEGGGSLHMLIGELRADVRNILADIVEIKNNQEINRSRASAEHEAVRSQIASLTRDLKSMREQVSRTARR